MKKILFSMACVSFLFGNDYDVALEFYKKKEFNKNSLPFDFHHFYGC